jgi:hypothetical protein
MKTLQSQWYKIVQVYVGIREKKEKGKKKRKEKKKKQEGWW